jgi:ubiquinone/menaquinone biosynthesis C-methylase UbiE
MHLVHADVHALPFRDHTFDRVFHVGGAATFRNPRTALSEMARVAQPNTPIVVVDEQLDPNRDHCLHHRLLFRLLTFYDWNPQSPREHLPEEAIGVVDEQASRFYYSLTFRMPPRRQPEGTRHLNPTGPT